MTVNVVDEHIEGGDIDYRGLFESGKQNIIGDAGQLVFDHTDGENPNASWTGASLGGIDGCMVHKFEGVVLISEGAGDESLPPTAWLIITGESGDVVRVHVDLGTGERVLTPLASDPQEALADISRIRDIMNGMKSSDGSLTPGF